MRSPRRKLKSTNILDNIKLYTEYERINPPADIYIRQLRWCLSRYTVSHGGLFPEKILEVGIGWGASTVYWLHDTPANLVTIDISADGWGGGALLKSLPRDLQNRWTFITGNGADVVDQLQTKVDFAYIDSNHDYESCLAELRAVYNKMRQRGVITGHDYEAHDTVAQAVNEFVAETCSHLEVDLETNWTGMYAIYPPENTPEEIVTVD